MDTGALRHEAGRLIPARPPSVTGLESDRRRLRMAYGDEARRRAGPEDLRSVSVVAVTEAGRTALEALFRSYIERVRALTLGPVLDAEHLLILDTSITEVP